MPIHPPFDFREIPLSSAWFRKKAEAFLASHGLSLDSGVDILFGVYDAEDNLVGTGGLDGDTIKCLALIPEARGHDLGSSIVSRLYSHALDRGARCVTAYTGPSNLKMLESLGFRCVGRAEKAVMLEAGELGIDDYCAALRSLPRSANGSNGVIVMNANPPTLGHIHLIKEASKKVECLTVIPLLDPRNPRFTAGQRIEALRRLAAPLGNVTIAPPSIYTISAATFPSYFIKESSEVAEAQMRLDLDIFLRHIAPALDAGVRFVGTEPADPLTRSYNEAMKITLPRAGVAVTELPRLGIDGSPVSASKVRSLLDNGEMYQAMALVPPESLCMLLADVARLALLEELELTPKPGLVDRHDPGAHRDMDFPLMALSAEVVGRGMERLARIAWDTTDINLRVERLVMEAKALEERMLEATGGVNTHRGAIFSMGLAVAATSGLLRQNIREHGMRSSLPLSPEAIGAEIAAMAALIHRPENTHGAKTRERYGCPGALDEARDGYARLFSEWLPDLKPGTAPYSRQETLTRLLLKIISRLPDTNVLWRVGPEKAVKAKNSAAVLLNDFSISGVEELNRAFSAANISHGGAADMLALTIFISKFIQWT